MSMDWDYLNFINYFCCFSVFISATFIVFICATLLTYTARVYALRHRIIDIPNHRSSHVTPTPRGGGIAVVIAFNAAIFYCWIMHIIPAELAYALIGGGLTIAILGFCDDLFQVPTLLRILFHMLSAAWALYWLGGLPILNFGSNLQLNLHWAGTCIGIISIVWLTNLYNFMDGIDGLAASEGLFVSIAASLILFYLQQASCAFLFMLFAASIAGFLIWNWPPAKIFLGDVGSGFLGYTLAVLGIYSVNETPLTLSFWIILLAVFICDATFTVIHRGLQGKAWYTAHREHAYQRLILFGYSHQQISLAILCLNVLILLPLAIMTLTNPQTAVWLMMITVCCLYGLWIAIVKNVRILPA